MNLLIVLLNRVYLFLTKVKNQNPLLGASILVSILIGLFIRNIFLFIYAFKPIPLRTYVWRDYFVIFLVFLLTYFYARKKKLQVVNRSLFSGTSNNLVVVILYIFIVMSYAFLAQINRDKILAKTKTEDFDEPRKESLEGKIRRWFE